MKERFVIVWRRVGVEVCNGMWEWERKEREERFLWQKKGTPAKEVQTHKEEGAQGLNYARSNYLQ